MIMVLSYHSCKTIIPHVQFNCSTRMELNSYKVNDNKTDTYPFT